LHAGIARAAASGQGKPQGLTGTSTRSLPDHQAAVHDVESHGKILRCRKSLGAGEHIHRSVVVILAISRKVADAEAVPVFGSAPCPEGRAVIPGAPTTAGKSFPGETTQYLISYIAASATVVAHVENNGGCPGYHLEIFQEGIGGFVGLETVQRHQRDTVL
jgi:hypothetical protein